LIFEKIFQDIQEIIKEKKSFQLEHITINISAVHFLQPHFIERLMLLVQKYRIQPKWIELELTESSIMKNIKKVTQKIRALKAFGFFFSIDDFGTGYSSLTYLKELPIDTIKIDKSFVLSMHKNTDDAMIVESIVSIGKKFHLKVLAEGVENEEVIECLKHIECDYYQGNYAYKPLKLATFKTLF